MEDLDRPNNTDNGLTRVWNLIIKFFSSLQVAVILILILVGLSLIGSLVVQAPSNYKIDPESYTWWLQNVGHPQTGFWFPLLNILGLFDVFHSAWFLISGGLLIISIIVCGLNRLRRTKANISSTRPQTDTGFYNSGQDSMSSLNLPQKIDPASNILVRSLQKHRYQVIKINSTENFFAAGDKNRFSPLGTYLIHSGIILLIIGYLIGSYLGFKDTDFIVPEGAQKNIGHDTELTLQLNSFSSESWPDGIPKDYRSDVTLKQGRENVANGIVRVNHPLSYKGIRVLLAEGGPAAHIQIKNTDSKKILFDGNVALYDIWVNHPFQRPIGDYSLDQEGYVLIIVGRAVNSEDTVLNQDQIAMEVYQRNSNIPLASATLDKGIPYPVKDLEISYLGDARYSKFQVSRDPGNGLIWAASALFILGLIIVFYFPRRRVWVAVQNAPKDGSQLWILIGSGRGQGLSRELASLISDIKKHSGLKDSK